MTKTTAPKYDAATGALLPTPYESRIKGGDQLVVGKRYRLEVVGGKNPPSIAKPGVSFTAVGDSEGNYCGEVIGIDGEHAFHVFSTDANDLWIAA